MRLPCPWYTGPVWRTCAIEVEHWTCPGYCSRTREYVERVWREMMAEIEQEADEAGQAFRVPEDLPF